jgi:hypothetical protein
LLPPSPQWIDRVKEFLTDGVGADIESLQELLDETEGMPVAMVEADLLRAHIEALQWAAKAKPILEKDKMKLSSLQRLSRDIAKIRNMSSSDAVAGAAEQFAVTLPEETKLAEILSSYQRWQDSVKKIFHVGSLKAGITLQTLQSLLEECDGMLPIELELESKQIRSLVSEASDWIKSFADVLEALHIPITSIPITPPAPVDPPAVLISEGGVAEVSAVTEEVAATETKIGYNDLKILIDAAHNVTVQFPELMSVPSFPFPFPPLRSL